VEVLEQIRLLTNLETNQRKLLQIIMVGQPEIMEKLSQPQLRQLSQRITARCHLGPLSKKEVAAYVNYRLSVAGLVRGGLFPRSTLGRLFRLTGGIPRLINVICDRALLGSYVQGRDRVDLKTLKTAAREVSGKGPRQHRRRTYQAIAAAILLTVCAVLLAAYYITGHYMPGARPVWKATLATAVQEPAAGVKADASKIRPLERPDPSGAATRDMAYRTLFARWDIRYDREDGQTVSQQARRQGLRSEEGIGSVSDLRQMNKPVALKLLDDKSGEYYATLTSLQGEDAVLTFGDEKRTVDLKELSKSWSGEYLLLWRAPREYRKELKPGEGGPLVAWIDRQLSLAQGRPVEARQGQLYGDEMVKRVKEFQRAAGLKPDGTVGPRTIMRLSAVDNREPALDEGQGG
jgi:general secretion pathway protein A